MMSSQDKHRINRQTEQAARLDVQALQADSTAYREGKQAAKTLSQYKQTGDKLE